MHLKSYPKLVRSELRVDACGVQTSQRGGVFVSRLPLGVLSTNTLRCSNATNLSSSGGARLKASPGVPTLQLPPPSPGSENDTLRLYQHATEDADTPLDIWTVIKPGHVREKIAIFASDGDHVDGARSGERTCTSPDSLDRMAALCTNHAAASLRTGKAKGSWEENCSAKRRRRSGNNPNLQQDPKPRDPPPHKPSPQRSVAAQRLGGGGGGGGGEAAAEEEQKVSVVEMVAFLEQRASEQPDKPLLALQRSSTTITLSRAPPPELRGEEPESVRVSDMVARLESECLRRRTEGDLSRSNSLRRTVGRVLLAAAGDQSSAPCQPPSSLLPGAEGREPIGCSETAASALTPPSSGGAGAGADGPELQSAEAPPPKHAPPSPCEEAEPVPGLLFLSPVASEPRPHTDRKPRPPHHRETFDLEPAPAQPRPPRSDSGGQSEKRRRRRRADEAEEEAGPALVERCASASQDFLLMRQRVQQLLEPQPFLAALPHHLLLKILLLLPTQSLAALKCSCHYFKFVIDTYGVRPADSLWVSDPRYRDDPCKQCKKRYGRGDVSLCRWHHKPYCQALPYGPGYWMCCHGARRDAPGCNVGLHDNRWVPAFHSINVPIYRRGRHDD